MHSYDRRAEMIDRPLHFGLSKATIEQALRERDWHAPREQPWEGEAPAEPLGNAKKRLSGSFALPGSSPLRLLDLPWPFVSCRLINSSEFAPHV